MLMMIWVWDGDRTIPGWTCTGYLCMSMRRIMKCWIFFLQLCNDGYLGTFMLLGYDYDTRVVSYFVKRVSFVLW